MAWLTSGGSCVLEVAGEGLLYEAAADGLGDSLRAGAQAGDIAGASCVGVCLPLEGGLWLLRRVSASLAYAWSTPSTLLVSTGVDRPMLPHGAVAFFEFAL